MKKTLIIFMLVLAVIIANPSAVAADSSVLVQGTAVAAAEQKYTDISGHWAEDAIASIADPGLFADKGGKFQPDRPITRNEFVMMLHKAMGIQIMYFKATDIGEFFNDVKNEDVYASALYDLTIAGIIDYKGKFKPEGTLTREETVHFMMNAYKYKMGDKFKQIKLSSIPFTDNDKISPVYSGEIARAEHDGLIKRPPNSKFYPKDTATRAQAATVIDRLRKLIEKEALQVMVTPSAELKDGTLHMKLTIANSSSAKLVISHGSGQKSDFALLDANRKVLYRWSADKMFTMALTETSVEPGKSVEFSADVSRDTYDGALGKAVYMKAYITGSSESFKINTDGYEATIR